MALDLGALEGKTDAPQKAVGASNGSPLDLPLGHVHEDPNQPRKEFDAAALKELTDSIKADRVYTPVSVRSHPEREGHYVLNYGARRFRASKAAGKKTIPAFVDEKHTRAAQVIENTHRDNLKPMELALYIEDQRQSGASKKEIAASLSLPASTISEHSALIGMPDVLESAYRSGQVTSARTIYELRKLHDKHPEKVGRWASTRGEITRGMVAELGEKLSAGPKEKKAPVSKLPVLKVMVNGVEARLILNRSPGGSSVYVEIDGKEKIVDAKDCRLLSLSTSVAKKKGD